MKLPAWLDSWPGAVGMAVALHVGALGLTVDTQPIDEPEEFVDFELIELPAPDPTPPEPPPPEPVEPPGPKNPDPEADPTLPSVASNRPEPEEPPANPAIVTGIAVDEASLAPDGMSVPIGNTDKPGFEAAPGADLGGLGGFEGGGAGGGGLTNPDRPARLVRSFKPRYPTSLVATGIEGQVLLRVEVLPNGRAGDIQVLSSVHPELSQVAILAVQRFRWQPGVVDGKRIRTLERVSFRFTID